MLTMRELSDKFKLSVRSAGEVFEAINAMVYRYRTTGEVEFRGKLTREALVNAAILYVDSLPAPAKAEALRAGMLRLESILEGDDAPAPAAEPAPPPDKPLIGNLDVPKPRKTRRA